MQKEANMHVAASYSYISNIAQHLKHAIAMVHLGGMPVGKF